MEGFTELLARAEDSHEQREYIKEIQHLNDALQLATNEKDIASVYEKMGTCLYLLKNKEEAKKYYLLALAKAANIHDNDCEELTCLINYYLGTLYFAEESYEQALKHSTRAIECNDFFESSTYCVILNSIGVCLLKLGDLDKAIEYFQMALKVDNVTDQDKANIAASIGQCYDKQRNLKLSYDYFRMAFTFDPNYDGGWYLTYRFADIAYQFHDYSLSIAYFIRALREIPYNQIHYIQMSYKYLGYNKLSLKDYGSSITHFKNCLKVEPMTSNIKAELYAGIAQAYFGLNKIGKVIKFASKALTEEFDEVIEERMYFLLAFCYGMWGIHKDRKKELHFTEKLKSRFPQSHFLMDLEP